MELEFRYGYLNVIHVHSMTGTQTYRFRNGAGIPLRVIKVSCHEYEFLWSVTERKFRYGFLMEMGIPYIKFILQEHEFLSSVTELEFRYG